MLLGGRAQLCDICFDIIMKDRKKGKLISGLTTEDKISFLRTQTILWGLKFSGQMFPLSAEACLPDYGYVFGCTYLNCMEVGKRFRVAQLKILYIY